MADTYNLIVSLGGNCSAAHNLRYRGLRPCSLPFDWCYLVDDTPIRFWIDEVADGFPSLLKKENLQEILPGDKEYSPEHSDVWQYIDTKSGYRFVNHFHRSIDVPGEYKTVSAAIRRRAGRLVSAFNRGGTFLLLLATSVNVSVDLLEELLRTLAARFVNPRFELRYLHFAHGPDARLDGGNGVVIENIARSQNDYDFYKTNWEWHFLDDVSVSTKVRKPFKFSFDIWPKVRCHVTFKRKNSE